ncbi:hypothetical protein MPSI1_003786 [Malassezia psittaci]|uniref:Protein-lysine N-methyltransferase EFM4 n=1 Tax=Malassezia psittaci TaxID=1821823 RepID=A0AAF0FEM4_9BASI|nr:hypothetical protein MPSI1_003786 [Malassezia psittaci]
MAGSAKQVEDLPESQLGTKEHWDNVYAFGEDSVERMIRYLVETLEEEPFNEPPYVLDLGTGNGHLLFSLLEAGDELPAGTLDPERFCGVDYSNASVDLAKAIGKQRGECFERIQFQVADLREDSDVDKLKQAANHGHGWDILCDKGTFDAVALSSQPVHGRLPTDLYVSAVAKLLRRSSTERPSIFFITSCNFTQAELEQKFAPSGFEVIHVIPTPSFIFRRQERSWVPDFAIAGMPLYGDLCVRLQNASRAKLRSVPIPNTKANLWITSILLQHGFIYNVTRGTVAGPNTQEWNRVSDVRKRLWVDLKYRADDRPVLESMNLVSKPSRKLLMNSEELLRWVTGRRAKFVTPLRAGEIGIINCGKHGWLEAKEAMRQKLEGEVVCRVS